MVSYEVLSDKGVGYSEDGFNGGETAFWRKGTVIKQDDIDKGRITLGGLERLEAKGVVKNLLADKEAKGGKNKSV